VAEPGQKPDLGWCFVLSKKFEAVGEISTGFKQKEYYLGLNFVMV
jgi:hypothetical protein